MAQKNLANRVNRNRSSIVSQLHKLIVRYSPLVPMRDRAYINKIAQKGDSVYWLEENKNVLVAAVLIERDFDIKLGEVDLVNVGCFVSIKPGTMDRILEHIWQDFGDQNIYILTRPFLAQSLGLVDARRKLVSFEANEIHELASDLANTLTSYYNLSRQTIYQAMVTNQVSLYLQLNPESLLSLQQTHPALAVAYQAKLEVLETV